MSEFPSAPPASSERTSFFNVMLKAYTRPSVDNYRSLASSPDAKAGTAYLWVAIAAVISSVIGTVMSQVFRANQVMDFIYRYSGDLGWTIDVLPVPSLFSTLVSLICGVPIAAVIGVIGFAIGSGLLHLIAGLLGGKGDYGQLAYMLAAISVPFSIVSSVLSPIPYIGCITALISLYVLVLEVLAIDGVHQFGTGKAVITLLIPLFAVLLIGACIAIGIALLLVPVIRESTLLWLELGRGLLLGI